MQVLFLFLALLSVSRSATVKWTAAGGNPLWNNAQNWDSLRIPSASDDVIINIANIPGVVTIGGVVAPMVCNSLTVGGTTGTPQTLTIIGPLSVGKGSSKIYPTGHLILRGAPDGPLKNEGTFSVEGGTFEFNTGTIAGSGKFVFQKSVLNFTGNALKEIKTTVEAENVEFVTGTSSALLVNGADFTVSGTMTAENDLSLDSPSNSTTQLKITGTLAFSGSKLLIEGKPVINRLKSSGAVTFVNQGSVSSLELSSSGVVSFIGAPEEERNIGSISGSGVLRVSGGKNIFGKIKLPQVFLTSGDLKCSSATIKHLSVSGGSVSDCAFVLSSFSWGNGLFVDSSISVGNLTIGGVVTLGSGSSINVLKSGSTRSSSQIQFDNDALLVVDSNAVVTQSSSLRVITSNVTGHQLIIQGKWSSSATLSAFGTSIVGSGVLELSKSGVVEVTNCNISMAKISSVGHFNLVHSYLNVTEAAGSGSYTGNPLPLVAQSFSAGTLILEGGEAYIEEGSIATLQIKAGEVGVTNALSAGGVTVNGGKISGASSNSTIAASSLTINADQSTFESIEFVTSRLNYECSGHCQIISKDSVIKTSQ